MVKDKNKFNFFIPAEFVKGGKDNKTMYIKGVASSEVEDTDGETLVPAGYDLTPLLESGFLNYNHQANKDPEAIIGEPTKAEIINGGKDLYIEGFLYPDSEAAQKTYKLAQILEKNSPNRRMGFSIEGKALEKDPLNPKRITKARITGVAITPCPKNPNTLLSIMKGEYSEPFIETFESDDEVDKAITAAGGEGVTQTEDVDGGKKVFDQMLEDQKKQEKKNTYLKKSEVYSLIINKYSDYIGQDIKKAQDIYSLIQKFNTKLYGMENNKNEVVISDALEKALSVLDNQLEQIQKGENNEEVKSEEVISKSEEATEEVEVKEEIVKSEDASDPVEKVEEVIVKSQDNTGLDNFIKSFVKEQISKGVEHDAIIAELISKGCESDFSSNLVKSVAEEMSNLEANGGLADNGLKTEQESPAIVKSEVDINLIKSEITDEFKKGQDVIIQNLETRFVAIGNVLKSALEQLNEHKEIMSNLKQENTGLKKSLADYSVKLESFASQPQRARTITSATQVVNRFDNDIKKSESGKEVLRLTSKSDMNVLSQRLNEQFDIKKSRNESTLAIGNALLELNTTGEMEMSTINGIQRDLNALGIELVK